MRTCGKRERGAAGRLRFNKKDAWMQGLSSLQRRPSCAVLAVALMAATAMHAAPALAQKKGADWTSKLEPRTRTIQLCNFAALRAFSKEKKLKPRPDRALVNAGSEPKIEATVVTGKTGAVRSGPRWYNFTFTCTLAPDGKQTSAFTYEIGKEIPKSQWEKLGLWE